jgi:hypothetical protein
VTREALDAMRHEPVSSEDTNEPTKISSSLQAILHGGEGGMETIGVPLPLPDAVVRVGMLGDGGAAADDARARPPYRERLFRRVRSSDSVVRYYEHADGIEGVAAGVRFPVRVCCVCGGRSEQYFVRTLPLAANLTMDSRAMCAACYVREPNE